MVGEGIRVRPRFAFCLPTRVAGTKNVPPTEREFDAGAAVPHSENPPASTAGRGSQAVFARHFNLSTGLVSQWERGEKRPQGASLKLLNLVANKGLNAVA